MRHSLSLSSQWPKPSPLKKLANTRLPSVGFRSWSLFLAVSLQVTWVINPAVGCHYFPPGLQSPPRPLRGLVPVSLLGEQRHDSARWVWTVCLRLLPDSVATVIWTRAFCARVQHANHSATEPSLGLQVTINTWKFSNINAVCRTGYV